MRPLRLRLGSQQCLLLSPRDVVEVHDRATAELLVSENNLDPALAEAMVEALLAGTHVVIRLDGEVRMLDEPRVTPLIDPSDPVVDGPRPTWISVEVVHTAGISTEGIELHLVTPEGRGIYGKLGVDGRWRSDAVTRGTCDFSLLDHEALRVRPRVVDSRAVGEGETQWEVGKTRQLELASTAHHRVWITSPRPLLFSV